jgi:hypothetical protein
VAGLRASGRPENILQRVERPGVTFVCALPAQGKTRLTEVIKEEFGLGLRKDLKNERGKYQNGWKGLTASARLNPVEHLQN